MTYPYCVTGQDILQVVLMTAGEKTALTGVTSDYLTIAKGFIQRSYYDILEYAPWPWALKDPPGILTVMAKKTNTATVTNGSTTVTLGTSIAESVAGWWFQIDDEATPYRITAHTAGTTGLTLDSSYTETNGAGLTCKIYKDEYELATHCLKVWWAWNRNDPNNPIEVINPREMHDRYTSRDRPGTDVRIMSIVKEDKARVIPYPETNDITIEYEYVEKPASELTFDGVANTDTPVVPVSDRHVIADAATALLMEIKNDPRAGDMAGMVTSKLKLMENTWVAPGKIRFYVKRGQGVWR